MRRSFSDIFNFARWLMPLLSTLSPVRLYALPQMAGVVEQRHAPRRSAWITGVFDDAQRGVVQPQSPHRGNRGLQRFAQQNAQAAAMPDDGNLSCGVLTPYLA